jgi:uncharacterized protein YraI
MISFPAASLVSRFYSLFCIIAVLLLAQVIPILAQGDEGDTCPGIVETALMMTGEDCTYTPRNEACFGHLDLTAVPRVDTEDFQFEHPGDMAYLGDLETLQLGPMDIVNRTWGVSLLRLEANLASPNQFATMLLFGGVQVTNAVETLPTIEVTAITGVNVRARPSMDSTIVGSIAVNDVLHANGRTEDNQWLRLDMPDHAIGWVYASLVNYSDEVTVLDVTEANTVASSHTPMQAFYLESGFADPLCEEAVPDGILIQTPENAADKVALIINEAEVLLGSTAFIRAERDDILRIYLVEGQAEVTADGETQLVPAGYYTEVPLTDLSASGPPTEPQSYDAADVAALPLDLLPTLSEEANEVEGIQVTDTACTVTAINTVNLRSGPGTNYERLDQLNAGETASVTGMSPAVDGYQWWQLSSDSWVRGDLVDISDACHSVEEVTTPEPPAAPVETSNSSSGGSGGGVWITPCSNSYLNLFACQSAGGYDIRSTCSYRLQMSAGASNEAEARDAAGGISFTVTMDGAGLAPETGILVRYDNYAGQWSTEQYYPSGILAAGSTHTVVGQTYQNGAPVGITPTCILRVH